MQNNCDIILKGVNLAYSDFTVFDNFDITFKANRISVILGQSGCGKTSLLNFVSDMVKEKSYVFQEDRLLAWCSAYENIEFVLKGICRDKRERDRRIVESLNAVGLLQNRNSKPSALSGGMRQRLSFARALAYDAPLILMDEPLQGQDIKKKKDLIDIIISTQLKKTKTIIYVTHDVSEAVLIGDEIFVLVYTGKTQICYRENIKTRAIERDLKSTDLLSLQATLISLFF